jgi:hypothetical protein
MEPFDFRIKALQIEHKEGMTKVFYDGNEITEGISKIEFLVDGKDHTCAFPHVVLTYSWPGEISILTDEAKVLAVRELRQ